MKKIQLTQGKFAIVDDEDFEWLSKYKWYAHKNCNTFYAVRNIGKRPYRKQLTMHRAILQKYYGLFLARKEIDHQDGNGLNNRKFNIRICTRLENQRNLKRISPHSSRYKGVFWDKNRNKYRAQIKVNRKSIILGRFNNEIEAAKAYDKKAKDLFGEFAKVNF